LDHDSIPSEDLIKNYFNYYNSLSKEEQKKIGILVPNIIDNNVKKKCFYIKDEGIYIKRELLTENNIIDDVITSISSGSCVKVSVIKEIGLMISDLFIDYIDIEFSLRTQLYGYKIVAIGNAKLFHSLGNRKYFKVLGCKMLLNNHSPLRKYYIFRNRIFIWKKYYKHNIKYISFDFLLFIYEIFKIILFEDNKKSNFKNIFSGIKDGIFYNLDSNYSDRYFD